MSELQIEKLCKMLVCENMSLYTYLHVFIDRQTAITPSSYECDEAGKTTACIFTIPPCYNGEVQVIVTGHVDPNGNVLPKTVEHHKLQASEMDQRHIIKLKKIEKKNEKRLSYHQDLARLEKKQTDEQNGLDREVRQAAEIVGYPVPQDEAERMRQRLIAKQRAETKSFREYWSKVGKPKEVTITNLPVGGLIRVKADIQGKTIYTSDSIRFPTLDVYVPYNVAEITIEVAVSINALMSHITADLTPFGLDEEVYVEYR